MSLAGCQINPIDVNFYLHISLEIFDKNSADKIQKGQGDKNSCQLVLRWSNLFLFLIIQLKSFV